MGGRRLERELKGEIRQEKINRKRWGERRKEGAKGKKVYCYKLNNRFNNYFEWLHIIKRGYFIHLRKSIIPKKNPKKSIKNRDRRVNKIYKKIWKNIKFYKPRKIDLKFNKN